MPEEAREFTEVILGAAHAVLPKARWILRRLGWCERLAVGAALLAALDKKREARRQCKTKHTTATWKVLRAACKEVRAVIDKGIEVHLEEYVAARDTAPTPRYEGPIIIIIIIIISAHKSDLSNPWSPIQTPKKDGGSGREGN